MGLERSQLLQHPDKHSSLFCPALQSECWKKENGVPPGAENPHGEIYHSQSRCFLANLTSQLLPGEKTRQPSQIPAPKEVELAGRCYLHHCTERGAYKVQAEGSPWASCLPGKAIQVRVTRERATAHGQKEMLIWWYYPCFDVLFLFTKYPLSP